MSNIVLTEAILLSTIERIVAVIEDNNGYDSELAIGEITDILIEKNFIKQF